MAYCEHCGGEIKHLAEGTSEPLTLDLGTNPEIVPDIRNKERDLSEIKNMSPEQVSAQSLGLDTPAPQSEAPVQDMDQSSPAQAAMPEPHMPQERSPQEAQASIPIQELIQHMPETHKEAVTQESIKEDQAWANDLKNGHIKPETYKDIFAKKDTLGKIGTIFGLLIGGAGAGLTHQPNALLEMMNKEIDKDMEAQKQSKTNAFNTNTLNQHQQFQNAQIMQMQKEGKLTEAQAKGAILDNSIKSQFNDRMKKNRAVLQHLTENASKLPPGSPQKQQADNALAMMYQTINNENYDLSSRAGAASALANFGNQGGSGNEQAFQQQNSMLRMSGNEALAKNSEAKHIPGFAGKASIDPTPSDRNELVGHQKLDAGLNNLLSFAKNHTTLIPGTPEYNQGQVLARKLQADVREGILGTVYREGEQPLLDKFVNSNPAGIEKWWKTIPQLQTLKDVNNKDMNIKLRALGLPAQKSSLPQKSDGSLVSKRGRPMVERNGKLYYK